MSWPVKAILASTILLAAPACGFHPLYAGGPEGLAGSRLSAIAVEPVVDTSIDNQEEQADPLRQSDKVLTGKAHESRLGQLLQDGLLRSLGHATAPRYRLKITINQSLAAFGIRKDESFTRLRLGLLAHYTLVDAETGSTLTSGEAFSDLGIDRVQSEYATLTAERNANQRNVTKLVDAITARLSLYLHDQPASP